MFVFPPSFPHSYSFVREWTNSLPWKLWNISGSHFVSLLFSFFLSSSLFFFRFWMVKLFSTYMLYFQLENSSTSSPSSPHLTESNSFLSCFFSTHSNLKQIHFYAHLCILLSSHHLPFFFLFAVFLFLPEYKFFRILVQQSLIYSLQNYGADGIVRCVKQNEWAHKEWDENLKRRVRKCEMTSS